jgi:S-adenosylmethionine synthetase
MAIVVTTAQELAPGPGEPEVVERKGIGHPDTICDALAEELSIALSRFYLSRFGTVLHHNVDKVLLAAGASRPAFGGGEVVAPIEIFFAGRAVLEHGGVVVPVRELGAAAARAWLRAHVPGLDLDRDVVFHWHLRPGAAELQDLLTRGTGVPLANDTSCGAGFAPATPLESAVLAAERLLTAPSTRLRHPHLGADVKVMGLRLPVGSSGRDAQAELTVACAQVDRHVRNASQYAENLAGAHRLVEEVARRHLDGSVSVSVNAGDDPERSQYYLTVTGTSAEAGDDGQTGRGNRVGGFIAPRRCMTMESVAGKNPINHVGKLYNVLAHEMAAALVAGREDVAGVECFLVSRIGRPIDEPDLVHVRVAPRGGASVDAAAAQAIAREHVAALPGMWRRFLERGFVLF